MRNIFLAALFSCEPPACGGMPVDSFTLTGGAPGGEAGGAIRIYFTQPGASSPVEESLVSLISSQGPGDLYVCLYEFDSEPVISAIEDAAARGAKICFVGDPDNAADEGYLRIKNIAPAADFVLPEEYRGDAIMHNKFVLVENPEGEKYLWCGSANASDSDMLYNNNNALVIRSDEVYEVYRRQMLFLLGEKKSGGETWPAVRGVERVQLGDALLEIFFSYAGDARPVEERPMTYVTNLARAATSDISFMIFTFTTQNYHEHDLAAALEDKSESVSVRGLFDRSQSVNPSTGEIYKLMKSGSMNVHLDGNEQMSGSSNFAGGKLHHKVMIVDANDQANAAVLTGSLNFTRSANTINAENSIIIHSYRTAQLFKAEFEKRWSEADNEN